MGKVFVQTGEWPREAILLGGQIGLLFAGVFHAVAYFSDRKTPPQYE